MSGTDIAAIIVAATAFVAALGRGVAWLVDTVQKQSDKTITSLEKETVEKDARIKILEDALRGAGVPLP